MLKRIVMSQVRPDTDEELLMSPVDALYSAPIHEDEGPCLTDEDVAPNQSLPAFNPAAAPSGGYTFPLLEYFHSRYVDNPKKQVVAPALPGLVSSLFKQKGEL